MFNALYCISNRIIGKEMVYYWMPLLSNRADSGDPFDDRAAKPCRFVLPNVDLPGSFKVKTIAGSVSGTLLPVNFKKE